MVYGVQTVIACIIIFLVPMLWMVSSSFKGSVDVTAYPPKLFFTPTLDNFRTLFSTVPFFRTWPTASSWPAAPRRWGWCWRCRRRSPCPGIG